MDKYILDSYEKKNIRMSTIAERNAPLDLLKRELRYRGAVWDATYWGVPNETFPNDSNTKKTYKRFGDTLEKYRK